MSARYWRHTLKETAILGRVAVPLRWARRITSMPRRRMEDRFFESMTAVVRDDILVYVSEFDGSFYLDQRSHLFRRIVSTGTYEPELVDFCRRFVDPGRDIIDVGANVGFYAVLFARLTEGRVLAIEPTRAALKRLERNIDINGVSDKVVVYRGAASSDVESVSMNVLEGFEEYSSLGHLSHPSTKGLQSSVEVVNTSTIDQLVDDYGLKPGFVKIDVEGMEHKVIEGCKAVLETHRPIILSEICDSMLMENGSSAQAVIFTLRKSGYRVIDPLEPRIAPGHRNFGDILCIPEERVPDMEMIASRGSKSGGHGGRG